MRKRTTSGLCEQRETSRPGTSGGPKVDRRIDPGRYPERTGRIGTDARRQTSERYLIIAAKTVAGNNREAYRCADRTLRNSYGAGAKRYREIRSLLLLNDGSCACTTASSKNSSKQNEDRARYTLNEPSQEMAPTNMAANGRCHETQRNNRIVTLRIYLTNTS